ncbi:MAG TPA: acyltransferase family protein, partial [Flavobacterium sp.]|nr:acyltransferase family protein [Flavobacterium sp.]
MLRSRGIFFCIFTGIERSLTIYKAAIKDSNRIFGLDFMRATAIMMVLIGHCAWIFPASEGVIMQLLAMSGYLGVEIFFVLSGFLIGNILY